MEADKPPGQELQIETALGKFGWKNFHLGNLLQLLITAGLAVGVLMFYEVREETRMWSKMTALTKNEHAVLLSLQEKNIRVLENNTAAIRFQTCVNSVPLEQRVHQLRARSTCWWMSQGYSFEESGPVERIPSR